MFNYSWLKCGICFLGEILAFWKSLFLPNWNENSNYFLENDIKGFGKSYSGLKCFAFIDKVLLCFSLDLYVMSCNTVMLVSGNHIISLNLMGWIAGFYSGRMMEQLHASSFNYRQNNEKPPSKVYYMHAWGLAGPCVLGSFSRGFILNAGLRDTFHYCFVREYGPEREPRDCGLTENLGGVSRKTLSCCLLPAVFRETQFW